MKNKPLIFNIILVVFLLVSFEGVSQDSFAEKIQPIMENFSAGVEYAQNSELGILGQYNFNNIAIVGYVRRCSHSKNIYITPGIKYYHTDVFYGITPFVNLRYGKLHYNRKWSSVGYDYDIVQVWDPVIGQYFPEVRPSYYGTSGTSLINTPALSLSGGGEYNIKNFGVNASIGASYFTKINGDFKNKCKLFFTVGVLYYFGEK
jgi:hypothetical protein